jgi:polyisoprenoid-binding protein YceI
MKRIAASLGFLFALVACNREVADKPAAKVSTEQQAGPVAAKPLVTSSTPVIKETSRIGFTAAKITRSHEGVFQQFDGKIDYAGAKPAGIEFTIDPASVKTDEAKLDGHLKSADFFDVQKFPMATFKSSGITAAPPGIGHGATHMITGTLDLHGVQKTITFPARVDVTPQGVHATSEFSINRQDWGVAYKGMPDDLIRDEVLIKLDLNFPSPPTA